MNKESEVAFIQRLLSTHIFLIPFPFFLLLEELVESILVFYWSKDWSIRLGDSNQQNKCFICSLNIHFHFFIIDNMRQKLRNFPGITILSRGQVWEWVTGLSGQQQTIIYMNSPVARPAADPEW